MVFESAKDIIHSNEDSQERMFQTKQKELKELKDKEKNQWEVTIFRLTLKKKENFFLVFMAWFFPSLFLIFKEFIDYY